MPAYVILIKWIVSVIMTKLHENLTGTSKLNKQFSKEYTCKIALDSSRFIVLDSLIGPR